MRILSLDGMHKGALTDNNSNSYIMYQPTDLFCHTVLIFAKFNMLTSFNPFLHKY